MIKNWFLYQNSGKKEEIEVSQKVWDKLKYRNK